MVKTSLQIAHCSSSDASWQGKSKTEFVTIVEKLVSLLLTLLIDRRFANDSSVPIVESHYVTFVPFARHSATRNMGKRWLPLESNPEVLNEFASKIGMAQDKFKFCDVFGMDPVRFLCMSPFGTATISIHSDRFKDRDPALISRAARLNATCCNRMMSLCTFSF